MPVVHVVRRTNWCTCTMRGRRRGAHPRGMTLTHGHTTTTSPPLSRAARLGAGACLIAAGLTNGLGQYVGELLMPELADFSAQIRWGAEHTAVHTAEQTALLVSMLVLPLGLLGLANVTRWAAPRLTGVGIVLTLWGMWGFHNVVALGYAAKPSARARSAPTPRSRSTRGSSTTSAPRSPPCCRTCSGSFLGLLLLAIAGLRSVSLPRAPGPAHRLPRVGLPAALGRAAGAAPVARRRAGVAWCRAGADAAGRVGGSGTRDRGRTDTGRVRLRHPALVVAAAAVTLGAVLTALASSSEGALWKMLLVALALGLPG